jgi:hypothetical protein
MGAYVMECLDEASGLFLADRSEFQQVFMLNGHAEVGSST